MERFRDALAAGLVLLVVAACKSGDGDASAGATPSSNPDCDPIVPEQCGFPFPSNQYLIDDPSTPTHKRVAFGLTTLPAYGGTTHPDPAAWAGSDGFSPGQAPMTYLPGATVTGLPTQDTFEASLDAASPTVLLEADTLARVPHFAELDASYLQDAQPTLMIRPAARLKDATRYIVAIRHVVDASGAPIPPSAAFRALRDGSPSSEPSVAKRRDAYAEIFGKLRAAGIDPSDLQVAWDYTTASRENNTRWLVHMRDDALAKVGADGPAYRVTRVEENPNPHIRRRIVGMMTAPLYLDQPGPGAHMVFGADGMPLQNGTAEFEFLVHVPNSVAAGGKPAPLVQNGHGLLGAKEEGQDGYLAEFADEKGYVAFAIDLAGFAAEDVGFIADTLVSDIGGFRHVVARQQQGLLNGLLLMRMMKGRFSRDPSVVFDGASVIDPSRAFYRGDSQGGIMGATYMALSTDVTRGLLGEPGMPYNLLLNRSSDSGAYLALLHATYASGAEIQLTLGVMQMLWDRSEPDGYAPYLTGEDPLPGTPPHQVLIHVAIGDRQVTPLGAHVLARTIHASNVNPTNRTIFGIPNADAPLDGPAMVEWGFGLPEAPRTNTPPPDYPDPHDKVRVLETAKTQSDVFFRTGKVEPICDVPCHAE